MLEVGPEGGGGGDGAEGGGGAGVLCLRRGLRDLDDHPHVV